MIRPRPLAFATALLTIGFYVARAAAEAQDSSSSSQIRITANGSAVVNMTVTVSGNAAATAPATAAGAKPAARAATRPTDAAALSAALTDRGALQSAKEPLGRLIQLSLKGSSIQLDREHWDETPGPNGTGRRGLPPLAPGDRFEALDQMFQQLGANQRWGSGLNVGNGSDYQVSMFSRDRLSGKLEWHDPAISLTLTEKETPRRRLEVSDDGDGTVRFILTNPRSDMLLLSQSRTGTVALVYLANGKTEAAAAESYAALYRAQRKLMDEQVLPLLQDIGLDLLIWPDSPTVYRAASALLADPKPETQATAAALIKQLDSDDFKSRDKATQELTDHYETYQAAITAAAADPTATPEAADRLHKILDQHPRDQKIARLIADMTLLDDPEFLEHLLSAVPADQRPAIAARLEKVRRR